MKAGPMTIDRFRHLAAAYGADFMRWPEQERNAAEDLLLRHAEARAILKQEAALDALLAMHPDTKPAPGALIGQLLNAVPAEPAPRGLLAWLADLWPGQARWPAPAACLSLALIMGMLAGGNLAWNPFQLAGTAQAQTQTVEEYLLASALAIGPADEDIAE